MVTTFYKVLVISPCSFFQKALFLHNRGWQSFSSRGPFNRGYLQAQAISNSAHAASPEAATLHLSQHCYCCCFYPLPGCCVGEASCSRNAAKAPSTAGRIWPMGQSLLTPACIRPSGNFALFAFQVIAFC